jgi:hypothetical protein
MERRKSGIFVQFSKNFQVFLCYQVMFLNFFQQIILVKKWVFSVSTWPCMHTCEHASWHPFKQAGMSRYHPPTTTTTAENKNELAISKSSRGLGLVACLEGQKINNMPNMASRKFSYIPKVICAAWNATIMIRYLLIYIYLAHDNLLSLQTSLQTSTRPSPLLDWEIG